jgi:signal transduction histidine kinase
MYSEMLRDGSVPSEQFKRDYYDFIFNESERLTRLINNILQLSNLRNQPFSVTPSYIQVTELVDIIRSKVDSLIKDNGFLLNIDLNLHSLNKVSVLADTDAVSQIAINITDNAIKFSNKVDAEDNNRKVFDLIVRQNPANQSEIQFEFRDYGEGVTEEQQAKIFDLFYRGGSELTRTTQGTGIGLALVKELMLAQQGKVDVIRKTPGLALLLTFKAKT